MNYLSELKLERKAIIDGLVYYLNDKTGSNITYDEKISGKYISRDGSWFSDTILTYNLKEDSNLLFSIKGIHERIVGEDGIVQKKFINMDKYVSYDMVKLIFLSLSQRYDVDLMGILDDISKCERYRYCYIEKESIYEVYDKYLSQKKLIK